MIRVYETMDYSFQTDVSLEEDFTLLRNLPNIDTEKTCSNECTTVAFECNAFVFESTSGNCVLYATMQHFGLSWQGDDSAYIRSIGNYT
jgi:hypothetical protein